MNLYNGGKWSHKSSRAAGGQREDCEAPREIQKITKKYALV